jgi:hypothetical protein
MLFVIRLGRSPNKTSVCLTGDVGSNMSLYLGASFVTLLEFIVLILRCAKRWATQIQ